MKRRAFLKAASALPALPPWWNGAASASPSPALPAGAYAPGRIPNEYSLLLPGEREALASPPQVAGFGDGTVQVGTQQFKLGDVHAGWELVAILGWLNGVATAVFEKHVTHQGALAYVTENGVIALIPKRIGDLSQIRPRPTATPHGARLERPARYVPGPDVPGQYILNSSEDPCYENVAALGPELIGWTLVANEEAGPEYSLFLEADGKSRQFAKTPDAAWAPDLSGRRFDPRRQLPSEYLYEYVPGYSKRTQLGGFLPAADIGVWNPHFQVGYEVMMVLPPGPNPEPIARIRAILPRDAHALIPVGDTGAAAAHTDRATVEHYWNGNREAFFASLIGIWNHWNDFFNNNMSVELPDPWLLDAARAGIVLARCSYRGLRPTYQIGEGAYTKIPERSHALFPVAHYEFVWTQQLWNLTSAVEPYFQFYLDNYILPDGNFLYNTQDQVEAPLNAGIFLEISARAYDYTHDLDALRRRLSVLRRMIAFVVERYQYSKTRFPAGDARHGLIWGSPEADNGEPNNDFPESHPFYYQNAAWIWRGLFEHARLLQNAAANTADATEAAAWKTESAALAALAAQLRSDIRASLERTLAAQSPALQHAGIAPFTPDDISRSPEQLSSYENHRYMMDWWTADWGDPQLDRGHLTHRRLAGQELLGMNLDGNYPRTSNFMEHGTLAVRIRQDDYRPFLLALYGNLCYAMDVGNRYAPEDALLPGNFPTEGSPYAWSAVVNSVLQPTLALRWLLCYEEHAYAPDAPPPPVHLQKAAPRHWFAGGERISVKRCPTRHGLLSWTTVTGAGEWTTTVQAPPDYPAPLILHIHPPDGRTLKRSSVGELRGQTVVLAPELWHDHTKIRITIA